MMLRVRAEHEVAFGLTEHFVDGGAEGVVAPIRAGLCRPIRRREMIARRSTPKRSTGSGICRITPQHRRRQQRGATRWRAHHGEGLLRIEARGAKGEHRNTVKPRRHQHIHQAGEPRPVGRRPHAVAGLRKEIEAQLDSRQVPEHRTMRLQRAFRIAGRARGEIEERWVVGSGIDIFKAVAGGFERSGKGRRIRRRPHRSGRRAPARAPGASPSPPSANWQGR